MGRQCVLDVLDSTGQRARDQVHDEETGSTGDHAEFEEVDYSYSFFHLVFALACMYVAMLMTGWGSPAAHQGKDTIDVGWTSYWVMGGLYTWTLVAPVLLKDREFL